MLSWIKSCSRYCEETTPVLAVFWLTSAWWQVSGDAVCALWPLLGWCLMLYGSVQLPSPGMGIFSSLAESRWCEEYESPFRVEILKGCNTSALVCCKGILNGIRLYAVTIISLRAKTYMVKPFGVFCFVFQYVLNTLISVTVHKKLHFMWEDSFGKMQMNELGMQNCSWWEKHECVDTC